MFPGSFRLKNIKGGILDLFDNPVGGLPFRRDMIFF
jgi:hypothetical protein